MRIALVHDYLKEFGGAEAVLETLSNIFPDADIFTTVYSPQFFGPHRSRLEKKWSHRIHQSFIGRLPYTFKFLSPLRFLSPLLFKSFNFSGYDLIITSATGAFFPNSLNKKSAKLICYCHTPPRYLYGLATARDTKDVFYRLVQIPLAITLHFYRLFDFTFAQNVDQFIANSATTAARIQKFYRRDAVIINPPVDLPKKAQPSFSGAQSSEGFIPEGREHRQKLNKPYYLTGGRLSWAKRYDIAIAACNKLNLPLKIFGRDFAGFEAKLKKMAGSTVEFLGEITQEQKTKLFSEAKAYFFCSDNEDFGMVSVEAQAYGCPVIGYRSGGIKETIIDGKTGVFFNDLTPESCISAVKRLEKLSINPTDCISNAQNFSPEKFISKIKKLVLLNTKS